MAEAVQRPFQESRLRHAWAALRGRAETRAAELDESVTFAELVWAHHRRQHEAEEGVLRGPWELEYRRRLRLFKLEQGELLETYWCRYEASGVGITVKLQPRRMTKLFRRDQIIRFHTATDWRTAHAARIESMLHRWETAAIKASEILRDASEKIALHRIFAASTRLLAFADRDDPDAAAADPELANVLREQAAELEEVDAFYQQAGQSSARIVYFRGMILGTVALAVAVGAAFGLGWTLGWIEPGHEPTYTLFVSVAMGAAGAILSVMTRMAKQDGFTLEFEVGRKSMRFLGGIRPWIGALFAFVVYLALKSGLAELLPEEDHGVYFYATVAFAAGFSERRAKVLLGGALDEPAAQEGSPGPREDARTELPPAGAAHPSADAGAVSDAHRT